MGRLLALTATVLMLAMPAPAFAAWEWTTWTMSAKDVIKGSGGRLKPAHGGEDDTVNGWWLRAAGPLNYDGLDFDGEFYFDKSGKTLHVIRLSLKNPDDCASLTKILKARHGEPVDASSPFFTVTLTVLEWADIGHGDYLALTSLPQIRSEPALCFIRYRPVGDPNGT